MFIIVASIVPFIFQVYRVNAIFIGILSALAIMMLITLLPGEFYTGRGLDGIPYLFVILLFVFSARIIYISRVVQKAYDAIIQSNLAKRLINWRKSTIMFVFGVVLTCAVIYFYYLSFISWSVLLPDFDIRN